MIPALLLQFVNTLSFAVLIPVLPFIVRSYGGSDITFGFLISAYSAFQFVGSPLLGGLSDSFGRRKLLIVSQFGTLVSWLVFGSAYFITNPTLALSILFFSRIIDGITGGNISVTQAYVSDISDNEQKARNFGLIGATFGVGMIVGPALGGLAASTSIGWLGTVILSALISFITLLAVYYYLPESLSEANRNKQAVVIKNELNLWKKWKHFEGNEVVRRLLGLKMSYNFALSGYTSIITLYLIDQFALDEKSIGLFLLFVGSFMIFNQGVVVPPFARRFGEELSLKIALFLFGIGLFLFPFPDFLWQFVLIYYLVNLGFNLIMTINKSLLAKSVKPSEQGQISGLEQSIGSLNGIIAPILSALLFAWYGAKAFWLFSLILFITLGWILLQKKQIKT